METGISVDFAAQNRYNGGRLAQGLERLSVELDELHQHYRKPIILTEFGADTIPGWRAQPAEMFSEEYQVEFLTRTSEVLRSRPCVVGEHVWNLCDFKTSQAITRMDGVNFKGVFTRDRRSKMAAHRLRELWSRRP